MLVGIRTQVFHGDLSSDGFRLATSAESIGWDIETSGLDWRSDSIGTCQLAVGDRVFIVIPYANVAPSRLCHLLQNPKVRKVFHHAAFDLRFMVHHWAAKPANIACTKIAAKILEPGLERADYSLKPVLRRYLSVDISKDQQLSDWLASSLTEDQLNYAASDVAYLVQLCDQLRNLCRAANLENELLESWNYLPTRVTLDLRGTGDVFIY
jgi:ribonuclease D